MRIALVTNSYQPNLNGVSVAVRNLELALVERGVEVFIITPKVPKVIYSDNVLAIRSTQTPKNISSDLRFPIFYSKVKDFLIENKIELLHSHDTIMGGLETVILAIELGIPCLHTYHTLLESYEYFKLPGYKQFIRSYSQIVCDSYDGVIALSDKIFTYLREINVNTTIHAVPNIFLPPEVSADFDETVAEFTKNNGLDQTFNIITFGRVAKEKNLEQSIELLAPLLKHYPTWRYIIAGGGPELENLKLITKKLDLSDQIIFSGPYSRSQICSLARICKVFLCTSYSEVQPTTPLEAMYYDLPVVCVDDLAFGYLMKDGFNGYCQPLKSLGYFCEQIYLNPLLQKSLAINAQSTAAKICATNPIQKYIDIYQQTINLNTISEPKNFLFYNLLRNLLTTQKQFDKLINSALVRPHL